jgi:hypothetical protein
MAINYLCKPQLRLAVVVWDGVITLEDWRAHLHRMLSDPEYAPMQSQLTDLRFSSISGKISDIKIQDMINSMAALRRNISLKKLAMVAGSEWNKPRLAALALKPFFVNSIVFNDLSTACVWLGVDAAEVGRDIQDLRLSLQQDS